MAFKCGFVTLIGQPNAGKSSLLNSLLNNEIAIVTPKAQTTRHAISGIINHADYQLIVVDTPGIHKPKDDFGRYLNKTSYSQIEDCNVLVFVFDGLNLFNRTENEILNRLNTLSFTGHKIAILNKIDKLKKEQILLKLNKINNLNYFDEIIPISALTRQNIDLLLEILLKQIPEGVPYFSQDTLIDKSIVFQIEEIIRQQILYMTEQELPHHMSVLVEEVAENEEDVYVRALIIVTKSSHKGMVIGKGGNKIRSIRINSQRKLRKIFNKPVMCELYVRIEEDWRNRLNKMNEFGYES